METEAAAHKAHAGRHRPHRAQKALYLATKKAERLYARALAGQIALDHDLPDKLNRAMKDIDSQRDALADAVQSLAATATGLCT